MLYGCAGKLEEGHRYDLRVEGIKTYKGLKEVTHAYVLKEKGNVSTIEKYYAHTQKLLQGKLE